MCFLVTIVRDDFCGDMNASVTPAIGTKFSGELIAEHHAFVAPIALIENHNVAFLDL